MRRLLLLVASLTILFPNAAYPICDACMTGSAIQNTSKVQMSAAQTPIEINKVQVSTVNLTTEVGVTSAEMVDLLNRLRSSVVAEMETASQKIEGSIGKHIEVKTALTSALLAEIKSSIFNIATTENSAMTSNELSQATIPESLTLSLSDTKSRQNILLQHKDRTFHFNNYFSRLTDRYQNIGTITTAEQYKMLISSGDKYSTAPHLYSYFNGQANNDESSQLANLFLFLVHGVKAPIIPKSSVDLIESQSSKARKQLLYSALSQLVSESISVDESLSVKDSLVDEEEMSSNVSDIVLSQNILTGFAPNIASQTRGRLPNHSKRLLVLLNQNQLALSQSILAQSQNEAIAMAVRK